MTIKPCAYETKWGEIVNMVPIFPPIPTGQIIRDPYPEIRIDRYGGVWELIRLKNNKSSVFPLIIFQGFSEIGTEG